MVETRLVRTIVTGYQLPLMGIHGLPHWGRVLETGLRLAGQTGADSRVVALFSVFHGARRQTEAVDPGHGLRGATLAEQLRPDLDLSDEQFALLTFACEHHTDGWTRGDITVCTCWDADRLDLWRVGIRPQWSRLCSNAARDPGLLEWAQKRSLSDHTPSFVTDEWIRAAPGAGS